MNGPMTTGLPFALCLPVGEIGRAVSSQAPFPDHSRTHAGTNATLAKQVGGAEQDEFCSRSQLARRRLRRALPPASKEGTAGEGPRGEARA